MTKVARLFVLLFLCISFFPRSAPTLAEAEGLPNKVLITELQIAGETSTDEFVEIFNPTNVDIRLASYRLTKKTASGAESSLISSFPSITLPSRKFLLITHQSGYRGSIPADLVYNTSQSLAKDNTVLLYDAAQHLMDKVGFGATSDFETQPALNPENRQSLGRIADRQDFTDTENNAADFTMNLIVNPQNLASEAFRKVDSEENTLNEQSDAMPPEGPQVIDEDNQNADNATAEGANTIQSTEATDTQQSAEDIAYVQDDHTQENTEPVVDSQVSAEQNVNVKTDEQLIAENAQDNAQQAQNSVQAPFPGSLLINEILPDPQPQDKEWIELYNATETTLDLTGLLVLEGGGGRTLLSGRLEPHAFLLLDTLQGQLNNSGDDIRVIDAVNAIIDKVVYGDWEDGDEVNHTPSSRKGQSIARRTDGINTGHANNDFAVTTHPTPGEQNRIIEPQVSEVQNVNPQNINTQRRPSNASNPYPRETGKIIISEIFPDPRENEEDEWIELQNMEERMIFLDGWRIMDKGGTEYVIHPNDFVNAAIPAKGYFLIPRRISRIALNNTDIEETLLSDPFGTLMDRVALMAENHEGESFARNRENAFQWTSRLTPGVQNDFSEHTQTIFADIDYYGPLETHQPIVFDASDSSIGSKQDTIIYSWNFGDGSSSEEMRIPHAYEEAGTYEIILKVSHGAEAAQTKLRLTIAGSAQEPQSVIFNHQNPFLSLIAEFTPNPKGDDSKEEWIELWNESDGDIALTGWKIQGEAQKRLFDLTPYILPAHKFLVFSSRRTKIQLRNTSDALMLLNPQGEVSERVSYEEAKEGQSYARFSQDFRWTEKTTPGLPNAMTPIQTGSVDSIPVRSSLASEKESSQKKAKQKAKTDIMNTNLESLNEVSEGQQVRLRGTVAAVPGVYGAQIMYITGSPGIQLYSYKKTWPLLAVGDVVEVEGVYKETSSGRRIVIKQKDDITRISQVDAPTPEVLEGEIDPDAAGHFMTSTGMIQEKGKDSLLLANTNGEIRVAIHKKSGIILADFHVGDEVSATGIIMIKRGLLQLVPRDKSDLVLLKEHTSLPIISLTKPNFSLSKNSTYFLLFLFPAVFCILFFMRKKKLV